MYIRNSIGPRTVPWGTPERTGWGEDCDPSETTLCDLPCQCLSEETLKDVGPFYLVSMPGEVKYPTSPRMCNCRGLHRPL